MSKSFETEPVAPRMPRVGWLTEWSRLTLWHAAQTASRTDSPLARVRVIDAAIDRVKATNPEAFRK